MVNVLLIGNDAPGILEEKEYLEVLGYEITVCQNGINGLEEGLSRHYDMIIMDLNLPGMDGFHLCRELRKKLTIPLLIVSEQVEEDDEIKSLAAGADDYIKKPFMPAVFIARVKANLAEYERMSHDSISHEDILSEGKLHLWPDSHRVFVGKKEIFLKNKEYEMLLFFMENKDIVFSKEELYENIWGMDAVGDNATVAVHVNRLREKIERDPSNPIYIQTVWGAGYRFSSSL